MRFTALHSSRAFGTLVGIVRGATLDDPDGLMEVRGKVHRHVKLRRVEQVRDPELEQLMQEALQAAQKRTKKGN